MLEVMIETWSNPQSGTTFRWSLWRDGARIAMGGPHQSARDSETEAAEFCADRLKRKPDWITRL